MVKKKRTRAVKTPPKPPDSFSSKDAKKAVAKVIAKRLETQKANCTSQRDVYCPYCGELFDDFCGLYDFEVEDSWADELTGDAQFTCNVCNNTFKCYAVETVLYSTYK